MKRKLEEREDSSTIERKRTRLLDSTGEDVAPQLCADTQDVRTIRRVEDRSHGSATVRRTIRLESARVSFIFEAQWTDTTNMAYVNDTARSV